MTRLSHFVLRTFPIPTEGDGIDTHSTTAESEDVFTVGVAFRTILNVSGGATIETLDLAEQWSSTPAPGFAGSWCCACGRMAATGTEPPACRLHVGEKHGR